MNPLVMARKTVSLVDRMRTAFMHIGRDVAIHRYAWLQCVDTGNLRQARLVIGDGTYIGHFVHLCCGNSLEIGKKVLIGDSVFITDTVHQYHDVSRPVMDNPVRVAGKVSIGHGSWIGTGAVIIGPVNIGSNCVVGAGSVVKTDLPDRCAAAGAPAVIIKRYDEKTGKWEKAGPSPK